MLSVSARRVWNEEINDVPDHRIVPPQEDEVLKLGPPAAGTIIVKVDPAKTGSAFVLGTETLLPGAEIPVHRHLQQDEVLFVHKGQGRATLNGQAMTVVPGMMVYVPRQAWHGLRNTGTGILEILWTSAPPGIELFFREYARLGDAPSLTALQELAQRCGMELAPPGEAAAIITPSAPRRGRHRRHRGHGDRGHQRDASQATLQESSPGVSRESTSQEQPGPTVASTPPAISSAPVLSPVATATTPDRPRRKRHRRGGRGAKPPVSGSAPAVARPAQPAPKAAVLSRPSSRLPRRDRRGRSGRVKEVYMGGRWVPVVGEGPMIAPGREYSRRSGGGAKGGDDDTPAGPLTVPL